MEATVMVDRLSRNDTEELRSAKLLLENPGIAAKMANVLASPIDKGLKLLPVAVQDQIQLITRNSLEKAMQVAIWTMRDGLRPSSNFIHKVSAVFTGAAGGAFGLPALAIELPITTTIMLRSIADIARNEGERLNSKESQLACLAVFAMGGPSRSDDAAESGYFAVRTLLAKSIADAAAHMASKDVAKEAAPVLVRLMTQVAARFSIPVTEKVVAQAVPVIGAAGGALINMLFMDHFQDMARGHFVVRRLERAHSPELVRTTYESLPKNGV
jgi:EcsC protein family